jgi:ElaB/YqjD/DUF883 family membrane-anchored ribosome-binding protein
MSTQTASDAMTSHRKKADSDETASAAEQMTTRMHDLLERGKAKATEVGDGFKSYVQDKPIQSLLIAAGAGLLVGYLCGRRR